MARHLQEGRESRRDDPERRRHADPLPRRRRGLARRRSGGARLADFTGLAAGETKTFTIHVERIFDCCPGACYVVTLVFDPDCAEGQPWDHSGKLVCVGEPSAPVLGVNR